MHFSLSPCMLSLNKPLIAQVPRKPESSKFVPVPISLLNPKPFLSPESPLLTPFLIQIFAKLMALSLTILCLANESSFGFKNYYGLAFIAEVKNNPHQTACKMWFPENLQALGMQIRKGSICHQHLPEKIAICICTPDPGWLQINQWLIQTRTRHRLKVLVEVDSEGRVKRAQLWKLGLRSPRHCQNRRLGSAFPGI